MYVLWKQQAFHGYNRFFFLSYIVCDTFSMELDLTELKAVNSAYIFSLLV